MQYYRTVVTLLNYMHSATGGPYQIFAGRDASRAFATLSLSKEELRDTWDELNDLKPGEQATLKEWEEKYIMKYKRIGTLLRERNKQ